MSVSVHECECACVSVSATLVANSVTCLKPKGMPRIIWILVTGLGLGLALGLCVSQ